MPLYSFFQIHQVLNATNNADIPEGLEKIEFVLEKGEGYMQMQNLWTALGAKYQPSVVYKMRLIAVLTDQINKFDPAISGISNQSFVSS